MTAAFRRFILHSFDIRPGEIRRALLMQLNFFLVISTLLVVKPAVNGLFLSEIGIEKLPLAFLLVAVSAVIISFAYSFFLNKTTLVRIILATLGISIAVFIFFGLMLLLNPGVSWFLYGFYVWVALFGVLTASQFWILANVVFNAREAKRLFGFIGAGAIAGGIFGGYLTTVLAELLGSEYLPFLAAALLTLCIPITVMIWKKDVLPNQSTFQRKKKIPRSSHPLRLILTSTHLTSLAAIIGVSVIVARLVDFQFSAIASYHIKDPDELTAFFGFWFSTFNVISLAIQLLLTRRLVGTLGVGTSLYFLPMLIFLGSIVLLFSPLLWAAIFIKLSDGSFKQSINKAAIELLALPIPSEVKNQTKTFIDVVVDSVATGISGLVLIFLVNGMGLSTSFISIIIILLLAVWLFFIWRIRKSYLLAFRTQMTKKQSSAENTAVLSHESILEDLRKVIQEGDENQILFVLKKLEKQHDHRLANDIAPLLKHSSDRVKAAAINHLYYKKTHNYLAEIQPMIRHAVQDVQVAAYEYLLAFTPENRLAVIERYLHDKDQDIRMTTLIALAEESRDNPVLKERFDLENRLRHTLEELRSVDETVHLAYLKKALLKALGLAKIERLFPSIESFLNDQDETVAVHAVRAAGSTLHAHFIPVLILCLQREPLAEASVAALRKYGPEIIKTLSGYLAAPETPLAVKRSIPAIAEAFGHQEATDLLFSMLKNPDANVRMEALKSLNAQRIYHPHLHFYDKKVIDLLVQEAHIIQSTLSVLYSQRSAAETHLEEDNELKTAARQELIQLLEERLDFDLERIFRLLGLKYPPQEVLTIFENIHSTQSDLRYNALEYLENLLEPNLKRLLVPILETVLLDAISEKALKGMNVRIPDEVASYKLLHSMGDEKLTMAVEKLLAQE